MYRSFKLLICRCFHSFPSSCFFVFFFPFFSFLAQFCIWFQIRKQNRLIYTHLIQEFGRIVCCVLCFISCSLFTVQCNIENIFRKWPEAQLSENCIQKQQTSSFSKSLPFPFSLCLCFSHILFSFVFYLIWNVTDSFFSLLLL